MPHGNQIRTAFVDNACLLLCQSGLIDLCRFGLLLFLRQLLRAFPGIVMNFR